MSSGHHAIMCSPYDSFTTTRTCVHVLFSTAELNGLVSAGQRRDQSIVCIYVRRSFNFVYTISPSCVKFFLNERGIDRVQTTTVSFNWLSLHEVYVTTTVADKTSYNSIDITTSMVNTTEQYSKCFDRH